MLQITQQTLLAKQSTAKFTFLIYRILILPTLSVDMPLLTVHGNTCKGYHSDPNDSAFFLKDATLSGNKLFAVSPASILGVEI